jgi:cytochrome c oxidase cbb3-type subunit 1
VVTAAAQSTERYNEDIVRAFVIATIFWGLAAFTVGVLIAFQLTYPVFNFGLEWTTFGRLRPLHTSAAIFAFGGNALLGTSFHVVQRTCRAPLWGGRATAWFVFWVTNSSSSWRGRAISWA